MSSFQTIQQDPLFCKGWVGITAGEFCTAMLTSAQWEFLSAKRWIVSHRAQYSLARGGRDYGVYVDASFVAHGGVRGK